MGSADAQTEYCLRIRNRVSSQRTLAIASALIGLLAACKAQDPATLEVHAGSAGKATQADVLAPRYQATLAEGMVLSRRGSPMWLAAVYGLSQQESWGRWTDGDVVVLRFVRPLPRNVSVELSGGAYGGNIGRPVRLSIGGVIREVVFQRGPFEGATTVRASFPNDGDSDTLVVLIPDARPASATDPRRLGLALTSIRIIGGG